MKGISPLIASVLLIAITMTLAAILATFVSNYTRQQLSALPSCVGGTLTYATSDYPKLGGTTDTVTATVEVENVALKNFTIEVMKTDGTVTKKDATGSQIDAGSAGQVVANGFSTLTTSAKARVAAGNCPSVRTDWVTLKP